MVLYKYNQTSFASLIYVKKELTYFKRKEMFEG